MTKEDLQNIVQGVTGTPRQGDPKASVCPFCGTSLTPEAELTHRAACWPKASELAQDPGGRFNPDGTLPQT